MRSVFLCIAVMLLVGPIAACSGHPQPPAGRWQGSYEDARLIVVARLEIDPKGVVRVSAPNAIGEMDTMSADARASLRARLFNELEKSWPAVSPLPLEFDGKEFRKPGGVAPQFEWDAAAGRMTMIYYSGNRPSVRVPLVPVLQFDNANS